MPVNTKLYNEMMKIRQDILARPPVFCIVTADIPKNQQSGGRAHTHRYWELKIDVDGEDASPVQVHIVAPNVVHCESNCQLTVGYNLTTLFLGVELQKWIENLDIALSSDNANLLSELSQPLLIMSQNPRYESIRNHIGMAILENLFILLDDYFATSEKSATVPVIKVAEAYLERNYYRPDLSIVELSAFLGMSQQHINKIFKESYGISLRQCLIAIRLNHARTMLETNKYLIKDVASMTGYKNAFYFCNAFRKYFGYPPRQIISHTSGRRSDTSILFNPGECRREMK